MIRLLLLKNDDTQTKYLYHQSYSYGLVTHSYYGFTIIKSVAGGYWLFCASWSYNPISGKRHNFTLATKDALQTSVRVGTRHD